jgi:hypothetical protein
MLISYREYSPYWDYTWLYNGAYDFERNLDSSMRPQNKLKAKGKVYAELEVKKRCLEEEIAEGL